MIEDAYTLGASLGLEVWCEDEAGPFQTVPHPGQSWQPAGQPARHPHAYVRDGTAKVLTLFRPSDGRVRIEGATSVTNAVLHPWMTRELAAILAERPAPPPTADAFRAAWERWQVGLTVPIRLPDHLPPLRVLLVLDNLAGHKTPAFVRWLFAHGVMPVYTPVGGSWRNMAESIQRVLKRRALDGQHPAHPADIIARFEAVAKHWNAAPTPFVWGGKRAARRKRQRERRHAVAGREHAPGDRSDSVMATGEASDPLTLHPVWRHSGAVRPSPDGASRCASRCWRCSPVPLSAPPPTTAPTG